MQIRFLTSAEVLTIHLDQIQNYGGEPTVRDKGLLESAVAQASAQFGGQYLQAFPDEMAATYLFHLVSNHPFVDGNKRTGLASALTFLTLNNVSYAIADKQALEDLVLRVAKGHATKAEVATFLREHIT
jgi:death on curing protein